MAERTRPLKLSAEEIKDALRRRHPAAYEGSMPGEWVTLEEWAGVDLLAMSAWAKAQRIGYEIKVSRSDYRREILKPHKRSASVEICSEFYFAVPKGLLTKEELEYEESLWEDGDFERVKCPAKCRKVSRWGYSYDNGRGPRRGTVEPESVPVPAVIDIGEPWWTKADHTTDEQRAAYHEGSLASALKQHGWTEIPCRECDGKGYIKGSRVEREAPTLWVPNDVGLIEVSRGGCRVTRKAPKREPASLIRGRQDLHRLLRYMSTHHDPRHSKQLRGKDAASASMS